MVTPRLTKYIPHDPLTNDRQWEALVVHRFVEHPDEPIEIFYGGAAGGGKSDWLLMGALQYVDQPDYAAIIFRRTYMQLSKPGALISRSKQWLKQTDARWVDQEKTWHFPSGAKLAFGYLESDGDEENYQSAEFQYIGFDELTHFTERQYTYLFSRLRRLEGMDIPLRLCGASNPGSRGHAWVRDRLVQGRAPNRVFVPARIDDNPHLDKPAYLTALAHLRPALQQQLRDGDWSAFEGMAYLVKEGVHVVPPFAIDNWWHRFEAMDYGTSNPTSWGCFATDYDGNVIAFGLHHEPGFPSDTAPKIHNARVRWWQRDDKGELQRAICYAPADIRTRYTKSEATGKEVSAETEFNELGIYFAHAQQDRRAGYIRISEMLKLDPDHVFPDWHPRAREKGAPRLYILDTEEMQPLISCLRDAPLEDVDANLSKLPGEAVEEDWESRIGHAHAMLRYALMSRPRSSAEPQKVEEDYRVARVAERLRAIEEREKKDLVDV